MLYHVIIYVPVSHADAVRTAIANVGAGRIGHYEACSFSSVGTGRFRPLQGSNPTIGTQGTLEEVAEERIEVVVEENHMQTVINAAKNAHPYEEPAIHVLPMEDYKSYL